MVFALYKYKTNTIHSPPPIELADYLLFAFAFVVEGQRLLGTILEGNGIKVSDYTIKTSTDKKCMVYEQTDSFSQSARDMANFFGCGLKKGPTDVYDIILSAGNLEKDWETE